MKTCSHCNKTKSTTSFYPKGKSLSSYCKDCFNKFCMKRWKEVKTKAINYKGNKCLDCNSKYPIEVYQFHHLDPFSKEYQWTKLRQLKWEKIVIELDKCILLCSNCHILRHSKNISDYE